MRFFVLIGLIVGLICCRPKQLIDYTASNKKIDTTLKTHALDSIAQPYRIKMQGEMAEVIGYTDSALLSYKPESPLGNFVADVVFEAGFNFAKDKAICTNENAIFSLVNFGGLRKSINKGEITRSDIYELMPFDNSIVILKISKNKMEELNQYLVRMNGQPVSNAIFMIGENTSGFQIGPNHINNLSEYYVVTSDYLAGGGDKMEFLKDPLEEWNTGILIRDALISFVQKEKKINYPKVESRMFIP